MIWLDSTKDKLMLSCDWLAWSGRLKTCVGDGIDNLTLECPKEMRLEILGGTNVFKYRAILYDWQGIKLLTIMWGPKSRNFLQTLVNFQIANKCFYDDTVANVISLSYIIHDYDFLCITRLDICVDFELSTKKRKFIQNLWQDKYYVSHKKRGSDWWHRDLTIKFPNCLYYGNNNSDFRWKIYDKSMELKVTTNAPLKPYIWELWSAFGFNITNVWRCEISIRKLDKIRVADFVDSDVAEKVSLDNVSSNEFLVRLYHDMYNNRLVCRKNEGHTRATNDTRVYLFEFPDVPPISKPKYTEPTAVEEKNTTNVNHLIKVLESDACKVNSRMFYMSAELFQSMVLDYHLENYVERVTGLRPDDYITKLYEEHGIGLVQVG